MTAPSGTPAAGADAADNGHQEIELKLAATPETLERLRTLPDIAACARNRGTVRRLESVYFDTAENALRQRGLSLRVRRSGRSFVQTLKTEIGANGGLARDEWEAPVGTPEPSLSALDGVAAERLPATLSATALKPVFTTRVQRHRRLLDHPPSDPAAGPASVVEIAFDKGTVEAEGGALPLSEIELELKSGRPAALYRLALALHEAAPLRLETEAKSDRGFRLATGDAPSWRKARPVALGKDDTAETAFVGILRSCIDHWLANQAAALDGRDPEGVHQMRVALRQFRSALPLFKHLVPSDQLAWLKAEAKWVADSLGPARDWDVFLTETLPPVEAAWPGDDGLARLRAGAEQARADGYRAVRETIDAPRYTAFLLRLGAWIEDREWRMAVPADDREAAEQALSEPASMVAARRLRKRHRAVRKAGRGFADLDAEHRHKVRIAVKKLRYAVGFFDPLYRGKRVRAYEKALKRLQKLLGSANDAAVAARLLSALPQTAEGGEAHAAGLILGWHGQRVAALQAGLVEAWDRFADARPFWNDRD